MTFFHHITGEKKLKRQKKTTREYQFTPLYQECFVEQLLLVTEGRTEQHMHRWKETQSDIRGVSTTQKATLGAPGIHFMKIEFINFVTHHTMS